MIYLMKNLFTKLPYQRTQQDILYQGTLCDTSVTKEQLQDFPYHTSFMIP